MNCRNYHPASYKRDPLCPYCVILVLYKALAKKDPNAPELTTAEYLLDREGVYRDAHGVD